MSIETQLAGLIGELPDGMTEDVALGTGLGGFRTLGGLAHDPLDVALFQPNHQIFDDQLIKLIFFLQSGNSALLAGMINVKIISKFVFLNAIG